MNTSDALTDDDSDEILFQNPPVVPEVSPAMAGCGGKTGGHTNVAILGASDGEKKCLDCGATWTDPKPSPPKPPQSNHDNALIERILAEEANRMTMAGTIPASGPAPSPSAGQDVRALFAETEAQLHEGCKLNLMVSNTPQKRQNRHVGFYGDPANPKRQGIWLGEATSDMAHWSETDNLALLQNAHVLPELQRQAGLTGVRTTLQTAIAEMNNTLAVNEAPRLLSDSVPRVSLRDV